jgi:hypothetical protein
MRILPTLHLILVSVWLGLVLVESLIEFNGEDDENYLTAARLHYRVDLFLEIPTVFAVLITGILLLIQVDVLTKVLLLKIILGLVAIGINFYCAGLVILRYRRSQDPLSLRRLTKQVRRTWVGVPFGLGAVYLGLRYFL